MATTTSVSFAARTFSSSASFHPRQHFAGDPCPALSLRFPQRTFCHLFRLQVVNEPKEMETSTETERSESDKLVDSMDFGVICNEFECISSPSVEATARQLVRDILELREGNRALGSFAVSVKYKDPLRTFIGREKYKRSLWSTVALDNPKAGVQEMTMLSTSQLIIKWTLKGKPKNPLISNITQNVILKINSKFIFNQISGQVIEHIESWDLSASSFIAKSYFWVSRRVFSIKESGKDTIDAIKGNVSRLSQKEENIEIYPDPSGDPTKFFQRDDGLLQDAYQIAIFLAVIYFVVQFLKATL